MRYILNEKLYLCGWEKLPFAIMNRETGRAYFFNKKQFNFLLKLSGKTDIDPETIDSEEKLILGDLVKSRLVREAADGETRSLYYTTYKGIYKKDVQWSITGRCNYRCRHCFQSAPEGILGEPTLEQCFYIIDQLDRCGIKSVALTGGEPLVRKDFFAIVDELMRREMKIITIYSNGKLITPEFINEIEKRKLKPGFQISFDGAGFHDWMRGVDGAEKIALDAFRLLESRGFGASAAMCLCRENVSSMRETVKLLASVGCKSLKFQSAMPQGEWLACREHYLTTAETFQAYLDYLPQYKEDGCPISIQMEAFFEYDKRREMYSIVGERDYREDALDYFAPCGIIQRSLYIGPNGAVTPCMSMCGAEIEKQFPNIFETPLEDILYKSSYTEMTGKKVSYVLDHNEKCHDCEYRARCCGGCRAAATGQSCGDYFAIDPITCEMFKGGWVDKAHEIGERLFKREDKMSEKTEC